MKYEKLIKDGKVAVIVSPGFGAGWSTWASEPFKEALMFDKNLVEFIQAGKLPEAEEYTNLHYPNTFCGGLDQAEIEWVPEGDQFYIEEYDGSESIHIAGGKEFYKA